MRWCLILMLTAATGCSGGGGTFEAPWAREASSGREGLSLVDSESFDSELSSLLRTQPRTVVVRPSGGFTIHEIPERLDRWLYSVQKSGGRVITRPDWTGMRGGSGRGAAIAVEEIYELDPRTYGPAAGYDVVVRHDIEGLVREVTFEKRS